MAKQNRPKRQGVPDSITELGRSVRRVFFLTKICDWVYQDLLFTGKDYPVINKKKIGEIRNLTTSFKNGLLLDLQALPDGNQLVRTVQVDLDAEKIKDFAYILELVNIIGTTPELITDLENLAQIELNKQQALQDGRDTKGAV